MEMEILLSAEHTTCCFWSSNCIICTHMWNGFVGVFVSEKALLHMCLHES